MNLLVLFSCLWLVGGGLLGYAIWKATHNGYKGDPLSTGFLATTLLRALPWAYLLSPTGVVAGIVGFPMPATMLLLASLLSQLWSAGKSTAADSTTMLAMVSFLFFWGLFTVIGYCVAASRFLNEHPEWPGKNDAGYHRPTAAFSTTHTVADYLAESSSSRPEINLTRCVLLLSFTTLVAAPALYWLHRYTSQ